MATQALRSLRRPLYSSLCRSLSAMSSSSPAGLSSRVLSSSSWIVSPRETLHPLRGQSRLFSSGGDGESGFVSGNSTLIQDVDPAFYVDPFKQDTLLTDIREEDLQHEIAEEFNVAFLSRASKDDISWPIKGFLYGRHSRPMVNLIIGRRKKLVNVFCIVDARSAYTYISSATMHALGVEDGFDSNVKATIHGLPMFAYVSPRDKHFPDVNLIGSDFLKRANTRLSIDYTKDLVELVSASLPRNLSSYVS